MAIHQSQTDQLKKVQLPSAIEQVLWTSRLAAVGGIVGLRVSTAFVGSNSELTTEISDKSGKTFGTFKNRITGNKFWADIKVPTGAKDALYATVKLPKHGLSMKSGPLVVVPPIEITHLRWSQEQARRGDVVKLTADVKGVPDGAEAQIEIWEHDQDGAHDFITKFPVVVKSKKVEAEWEYEYHEDTDDIPTQGELQPVGKNYNPPEYFFRVEIGGLNAESGLITFQDWIDVHVIDGTGRPVANAEYVLHLPDGNERKGRLDSDGSLRIPDNVPPGGYTIEIQDEP